MRHLIRWTALASALWVAACGSKATSPSDSGSGTTSSTTGKFQTTGRLIDAITSAAVSGVTATSSETRQTYATATDANGAFTLGVDSAGTSGLAFSFGGSTIVTRNTFIKVPGDAVTVTAIPKTFDLATFDEMCRTPMLMRWTSAPPLVVQSQVMQFTSANDASFVAVNETMTDAETNAMLADLSWALPQMTGGQFSNFASSSRGSGSAGSVITMRVNGQITVGRFAGLRATTGAVGLSTWQYQTDGRVVAGVIMLDRDFDQSGDGTIRAVRTHELGHALGYNHVTLALRQSVMNPTTRIEPNAGDLAATRLAFLRTPGNKSPDIDPGGFSTNSLRLTWAAPIR